MNLTRPAETPLRPVLHYVRRRALELGTSVMESEVIGALPGYTAFDVLKDALQAAGLKSGQVLWGKLAWFGRTSMNLPLPITATDFAPIIVSSPTIRSGTTLVQRLLCSARNTLIFGEACGQDLEILLKIVQSKALVYHHNKPQFEVALARMQSGEVNDWIIDLMPEIDSYVQALTAGVFSGLVNCRDYAAERDRPLWGFKYPGWPPHTLSLMNQFMPQSKWVYVYRDIEACLRSAKAWGEIHALSEAQAFCRDWAENLRFMQTWEGRPNVLMMDFAVLTSDPVESLQRLGEFTGALGMERAVFDHKINRESGKRNDVVGTGYLLPASLTEAEQRLVSEARTLLDSDNLNSTAKTPVDRQAGT